MHDQYHPIPEEERKKLEPRASFIGFKDPNYNAKQYDLHAQEYIADNPSGARGGKTPAERVALLQDLVPPGRTILEIGSGPGHDALELARAGYNVIASDVAEGFLAPLREKGLNTIRFDARKDLIPEGIDGIFTHISLHHISPRDLAVFLSRARNGLQNEKAVFMSVVEGRGHERSKRTGRFLRDWFYHTPDRLNQILDQEGIDVKTIERVMASNSTPTIHVTGTFRQEYKGGSYGENLIHPFGDVYYDVGNVLYDGDPVTDIIQAQVEAKILAPDVLEKFENAKRLLGLKRYSTDVFSRIVNTIWAEGLKGISVSEVTKHTEEFLANNSRKLRKFDTVFAIANNNGFSNTLNTNYPAWLTDVIARRVRADGYFSAQWSTDTGNPLTGTFTGDVYYFRNQPNKRRTLYSHQEELRSMLGPKYRRTTIGVAGSTEDSFAFATDYPVIFNPSEKDRQFAYRIGYYQDSKKQNIYADSHAWPRWELLEDVRVLGRYINIITSDRFPIRQYASEYSQKEMGRLPLWRSQVNELNKNYYQIGDNPEIWLL